MRHCHSGSKKYEADRFSKLKVYKTYESIKYGATHFYFQFHQSDTELWDKLE